MRNISLREVIAAVIMQVGKMNQGIKAVYTTFLFSCLCMCTAIIRLSSFFSPFETKDEDSIHCFQQNGGFIYISLMRMMVMYSRILSFIEKACTLSEIFANNDHIT